MSELTSYINKQMNLKLICRYLDASLLLYILTCLINTFVYLEKLQQDLVRLQYHSKAYLLQPGNRQRIE